MRVSRRRFVIGASVAALLVGAPELAHAWRHGSGSVFNGRKVQINAPFITSGGFWATDFMKMAGRWQNTDGTLFDIQTLDADGWATSLPSGSIFRIINIPPTEAVDDFTITWDNTGTISTPGTIVSGNYSTSGVRVILGVSGAAVDIALTITDIGTGIRNIKVVPTAEVGNGKLFRDDFVNLARYTSAIRMLNFVPGNTGTAVYWADRKPESYSTWSDHYYPPNKIVPPANVVYDGVDTYSVTWSGQTGPLLDKTQFIFKLPSTQTVFPAYLDLNGLSPTGALATVPGKRRKSNEAINANAWCLATWDADLGVWCVDYQGSGSTVGIVNGVPPEVMIKLCNAARCGIWPMPTQYMCDTNGTISDYQTSFMALANSGGSTGLLPGLPFWNEACPNELWNQNFQQTVYAQQKQLARNGAGPRIFEPNAVTTGASTVFTIGKHPFVIGDVFCWNNLNQNGVSPASGTAVITATSATTITVGTASSGTYNASNGNGHGFAGAAISGATAGATTRLEVGANYFQVGSLINVANVGGLTGFGSGTVCRVQSKPTSTSITVNVSTTGTYTSGGTITPADFDYNSWYGTVASLGFQAADTVFGSASRGTKYENVCAFQLVAGASPTTSVSGTGARLGSPFYTLNTGGPAALTMTSAIATATYFGPAITISSVTCTIGELVLGLEYFAATTDATRRAQILEEYAGAATDAVRPVNITNIAVGNPTVITVDDMKYFMAPPSSNSSSNPIYTSATGIGGTLGAALNGVSLNVISMSGNTITCNNNTTGLSGSIVGATLGTRPTMLGFAIPNLQARYWPPFYDNYCAPNGWKFVGYEGGWGPDLKTSDTSVPVLGVTRGTTTTINTGATAYDELLNVRGVTGLSLRLTGLGGITALNCQTPAAVTFSNGSANITWGGATVPVVGQAVVFETSTTNGVGPIDNATGQRIAKNRAFWVVSVAGSVIQVSATKGGAASTFNTSGAGSMTAGSSWMILSATGSSVVLDVDSSAMPDWTSGGNYVYPASNKSVSTVIEAAKGASATRTNTVANYNAWTAQGALAVNPSEFDFCGATTYAVFQDNIYAPIYVPQRWYGLTDWS